MNQEEEQETIYRTGYAQALKDVGEWLGQYIEDDIAMHYDFGGANGKRFAVFALEWKNVESLKRGEMPK